MGRCQSTYSEELNTGLCSNCKADGQTERELLAAAKAYQLYYPATIPLIPAASAASAAAAGTTSDGLEARQRPYPDKGGLRLPQPQGVNEEQEKKGEVEEVEDSREEVAEVKIQR